MVVGGFVGSKYYGGGQLCFMVFNRRGRGDALSVRL